MLKFTRKTEYALIALSYIKSAGGDTITSAREISDRYDIPYPLLAKILQQLARKRILKPVQGPRGGYKLLADLGKISVTDFLELLEGPLGIMNCYFDSDCDLVKRCNIRTPIQRINQNVRSMFDKLTVSEIT